MANNLDPYNPLDRYNKLLEKTLIGKLENEAGIYYKEMYIKGIRGKNGLSDTNEEDVWRKDGRKFIPGKIYTYEYDPLYKDILSFYDRRPIMFCIKPAFTAGTKNTIITGLNLAFLPPRVRISFLGDFWEFFNVFINEDLKAIYKGRKNSGWDKIPQAFYLWTRRMKMSRNFSAAFKFATRSYIIAGPDDGRMKNLRLMEYQHWHNIGFLNSKKYLTGASPSKIWGMFNQSKNK